MAERRYQLRRDDLTWSAFDDQIVVLDVRSSKYLTVTGAGIALWPLLQEGVTVDDCVAEVVERFDVDESTARRDVSAFLDLVDSRNLLA